MKRNDFITNVLKCNNFHCLASLRLVDLNLPFLSHLISGPGLASLRLVDLNYNQLKAVNEASGFKFHPPKKPTKCTRLASLRLVDLNRLPTKSLQNALGLASSEASVSKSDAACVQSPKSLLV